MPRTAASPARATRSATKRVATPDSKVKVTTRRAAKLAEADKAPAVEALSSDSEFNRSVLIYAICVSSLAAALAAVLSYAPPAPAKVCDGMSLQLLPNLIPAYGGMQATNDAILTMKKCADAYQKENWWFVFFFFEITYLGLKMFAIPATFAMCVLAGAIFPLHIAQLLTSTGETVGSTLCYLLSSVIAKPILERFAICKLRVLRAKTAVDRDNAFLFNLFLRACPPPLRTHAARMRRTRDASLAPRASTFRAPTERHAIATAGLSPFPNWLVNASSPIVGNPLPYFIAGTFFGTQLSIGFLAQGGSVIRTVGEGNFSLGALIKEMVPLSACMFFLQFVPLYLIRRKKAAAAAAKAK